MSHANSMGHSKECTKTCILQTHRLRSHGFKFQAHISKMIFIEAAAFEGYLPHIRGDVSTKAIDSLLERSGPHLFE